MLGTRIDFAAYSPSWRRGHARRWLLAGLLGLGGSSASGCRAPDCSNDTASEGTRFLIEVLEELPESDGCHLFGAEPGGTFFLTAGPTVEVAGHEGGHACPFTEVAGPPEGVESEFEYLGGCNRTGTLSGNCHIRLPDLCPGVADAGYISFYFRGSDHPAPPEDLLDATPSEARFEISTYVRDECSQDAGCTDKYRIRISRVMEE